MNHLEFIVYDDGCHLKKYAMDTVRCTATDTASKIAEMPIIVDKMHFKGHTDPWCAENCNPYSYKELEGVSYLYFLIKLLCYCLTCRWTLKYVSKLFLGYLAMPE